MDNRPLFISLAEDQQPPVSNRLAALRRAAGYGLAQLPDGSPVTEAEPGALLERHLRDYHAAEYTTGAVERQLSLQWHLDRDMARRFRVCSPACAQAIEASLAVDFETMKEALHVEF